MAKIKKALNKSGLQVVKKTYNGVTVGYVVGWWFYPRTYYGWGETRRLPVSFRSFRNGVVFETQEKAEEFRDKVEKMRTTSGVKFSKV